MMEIALTRGKHTTVDDDDYEFLNRFKWYAYASRNLFYARRAIYIEKKQKILYMHNVIMEPPDGLEVDHINGDGLNNTRSNLRICTRKENCMNLNKTRGASKYKGVCFDITQRWRMWSARITKNSKKRSLGYYDTELEAAKAYDLAAVKEFGEFAKLNCELFPEDFKENAYVIFYW